METLESKIRVIGLNGIIHAVITDQSVSQPRLISAEPWDVLRSIYVSNGKTTSRKSGLLLCRIGDRQFSYLLEGLGFAGKVYTLGSIFRTKSQATTSSSVLRFPVQSQTTPTTRIQVLASPQAVALSRNLRPPTMVPSVSLLVIAQGLRDAHGVPKSSPRAAGRHLK